MMTTTDKIKQEIIAYWFSVSLILLLVGRYGFQFLKWLLTALYEFFILNNAKPI